MRFQPATDSKLVSATIHDLRFLLQIRNDPTVRRAFFNSEKIGKKRHEAWLRYTLENPDVYLYIIQGIGTPSDYGYCRLACDDNEGEISIAILPQFRGRGIATFAIRSLIRRAKKLGIQPFAEVKRNNVASLKAFLKAGMRPRETVHFT